MSASRGDRRHSSLAQHRRHRKTLTPPLMALLNPEPHLDWRKKRVPDMLWLSAMVDVHAGDWQATHRALDALDPFVPAGESLWELVFNLVRTHILPLRCARGSCDSSGERLCHACREREAIRVESPIAAAANSDLR